MKGVGDAPDAPDAPSGALVGTSVAIGVGNRLGSRVAAMVDAGAAVGARVGVRDAAGVERAVVGVGVYAVAIDAGSLRAPLATPQPSAIVANSI